MASGPEVIPEWKSVMEEAGLISKDPSPETINLFAQRVDVTLVYAWRLLRGEDTYPSLGQQARIENFCQAIRWRHLVPMSEGEELPPVYPDHKK